MCCLRGEEYFLLNQESSLLRLCLFPSRKDTSHRKNPKQGVGLDMGEATVRGKSQDQLTSWKRSICPKGLRATADFFVFWVF